MNSTNTITNDKSISVGGFRNAVLSDCDTRPSIDIGEDIPMVLRSLNRWVNWNWEWNPKRNKWDKPPLMSTGARASSTNSATWTTYELAMQAHESTGLGIGFVLNGDGLIGLDLDDVRNPETREIAPWAQNIIDTAATYTEVSPSGTGVKLLLYGTLPERSRTVYSRDDGSKLEVFSTGRYFTITGNQVPGTPREINQRTVELHEIILMAEVWSSKQTRIQPSKLDREISDRTGDECDSDRVTAIAALTVLDPEMNYNEWLQVGMALHSIDPSESMLAIFDQWSRDGMKYVAGEPAEKWSSFTSNGGITISTLCQMADETGRDWRPRRTRSNPINAPFTTGIKKPSTPVSLPPLPWKEFPVHVLPDRFARFVTESSAALGCDPTLVALPAISVLASCVGNSRQIAIKKSWSEPCVIWTTTIAPPSSLKSPAWNVACAPLQQRQQDQFAIFQNEYDEHYRQLQIYESDNADWKKHGRKKGEPPPVLPQPPVCQRLLTSDATVEALLSILADNPRGCLYAVDELAGWLNSLNSYKRGKGSDREAYLSMHRAGSVTSDRKTGRRITCVPRAAVSICGTIQPGVYQKMAGIPEYRDSGMLARLLVARPPVRQKRWSERDVSNAVRADYAKLIDELLDIPMATTASEESEPIALPMNTEAKRLWAQWFDEFNAEIIKADELVAGYLGKLEAYGARFALLFQLIRNPNSNIIDETSMSAALTLTRWFAYETQRVISATNESDDQRDQRILMELIQRRGGEISVRELTQYDRRFRGDPASAERALAQLQTDGLGQFDTVTTASKPRHVFRLSKAVYVYESPENQLENDRNVDVDNVDTAELDHLATNNHTAFSHLHHAFPVNGIETTENTCKGV